MRHVFMLSIILCAYISVGGCGNSSSPAVVNDLTDGTPLPQVSTPAPPAEQPGLARFESPEALAAFLTERSLAESSGPTGPTGSSGPAAAAGAATPDGFSTTTVQEVGVDESDVVKNDGTHAFVLKDSEIRIVSIQPVETIQQVASVPIEGFGTALFLRENMLIALSVNSGLFGIPEPIASTDPSGSAKFSPTGPAPQTTVVTVINIANRSAPKIERTLTFEGSLADSRLIDGTLHLVLRDFLQFFSGAIVAEQLPEILPTFVDTAAVDSTATKQLVQATGFYRPSAATSAASFFPFSQTFTSVASIDLDDTGAPIDAIAILTAPGTLYVSLKSLYLTDSSCFGCFSITGSTGTTELHKVSLTRNGPTYVASGLVPGRPLNQFSFSEHEGFLRIATTIRPGPSNNLFVLGEADGLLEIVGQITNIAPGETIQSARFVGDRGFLVTFRRIDPLFTLDLSDPENPIAVGELKVPGFSTFLLPISDTELLGFGQNADERGRTTGLQLSIFDVSNFATPILKHHVTIGEQGTFSEALQNHKAFTYFATEEVVAFPVQEFQSDTGFTFIGLEVYRANGVTGFELLGRISTGTINGLIANPRYTRGVFIENEVYAITPDLIRAAPLQDIQSAPWSVVLGMPQSRSESTRLNSSHTDISRMPSSA